MYKHFILIATAALLALSCNREESEGDILPAMEQLNELMDDLGQPIKIKTYDRYADWQEADGQPSI